MGFFVEFVEPVLEYLAGVEGLADADRAAIVEGIAEELSRDADRFLALRPLAHESLCCRYDYPHATEHAIYSFELVVDASPMSMGVVRVVYVECAIEPLR